MNPVVAIVGRPNVGKSTLFNRLVGRRTAIVHDAPGVTRDRHYADAFVNGRDMTMIDTGGFDPETDDPMGKGIARHVRAAIEEADSILCVLDGTAPPTEADREAIKLLRSSSKPVVYVANKVDRPDLQLEANELYRLGIDPLFGISALHGRGMAKFQTALTRSLPKLDLDSSEEEEPDRTRVALIGRPNAGKSSLLNRLSGDERSLVDHRPGTTRDPIDVKLRYGGSNYLVIDTAGIRRKSRIHEDVEGASVIRALRIMERAEVVVLMVDATLGIAEQDARLLGLAADRKRAIIVGMNKMDLLTATEKKKVIFEAKTALHFATWASIFEISAKTGRGVKNMMAKVDSAAVQFRKRVPTAQLNRFFEEILATHPPPTEGGKAPRLYYITQAETAPPLFVVQASHDKNIKTSYKRYVQNQIRKAFEFDSIPVAVKYKPRRRRE